MYTKTSHFCLSMFYHRTATWLLLVIFLSSLAPSMSLAQQPTATISTVSGTVLVNGQEKGQGTVLSAGDVLETQAGASVVLELSDGSLLELGENTKLDIAELSQTAAGARVSHLKLLWGHIRTKLSSGHQQAGATFDIETPNALIGVKFSQPDVEVSYDPEKQETIGVAHTVELIAINLVTNEQITVPVGSTVIIVGLVMKVVSGTTAAAIVAGVAAAEAEIATAATATTTTAARIGKGTMIAIGAGAAVAVGGVALAASSGDGDSSGETSGSGNYTVSDLEGTWVGAWPVSFTFSVPMPVPFPVTEIPIAFVFDAQGNATNWEFSGFISRDCEKFRVSPSGEVSGTCYSEGIFEGLSVNWTYNFQGHFTSQDSMDMRLNGVGTGTETGTSVTVSCTGSGTLTHYK